MAQITIQQAPQQLNMANSDLIWVVTSPSSSRPQYQFVCSLQDGCGTTLTTIKQSANPSGKGVFNLGRIVKQYLDYDRHAFNIGSTGSLFNKNSETAKFFKVAFGEEWGTSTSSSVTSYTGVGNITGSAAQTGSIPYYYFINGFVDPNDGGFNWNTGSKFIMVETPSLATFNYNVALTDAPRTQYVTSNDYMSISFLNGNLAPTTSLATYAQDVTFVEYTVWSGSVSSSYLFDNTDLVSNYLRSGGPRTILTTRFSTVDDIQPCTNNRGSQASGSLLIHLGIGPKNLKDNGNIPAITGSWDYYDVKLYVQKSSSLGTFNENGIWDSFRVYNQENCTFNGVRFVWINNYGVWDWFNFTLADTKNTGISRDNYRQTFVDYSTGTNSVPYNIQRRGTSTFNTEINTEFTVTSDWLTQAQADWIEQLFYSPEVYIQSGSNFIPIVLTNNTFTSKTNPRSQKLFNYVVSYKHANQKRSR